MGMKFRHIDVGISFPCYGTGTAMHGNRKVSIPKAYCGNSVPTTDSKDLCLLNWSSLVYLNEASTVLFEVGRLLEILCEKLQAWIFGNVSTIRCFWYWRYLIHTGSAESSSNLSDWSVSLSAYTACLNLFREGLKKIVEFSIKVGGWGQQWTDFPLIFFLFFEKKYELKTLDVALGSF